MKLLSFISKYKKVIIFLFIFSPFFFLWFHQEKIEMKNIKVSEKMTSEKSNEYKIEINKEFFNKKIEIPESYQGMYTINSRRNSDGVVYFSNYDEKEYPQFLLTRCIIYNYHNLVNNTLALCKGYFDREMEEQEIKANCIDIILQYPHPRPACVTVRVLKEENILEVKSKEDLQKIFGNIDTPEKALSYVSLLTHSAPHFNVFGKQPKEDEKLYIERKDNGYFIELFSQPSCSHPYYQKIQYFVSISGDIEEIKRGEKQKLYMPVCNII